MPSPVEFLRHFHSEEEFGRLYSLFLSKTLLLIYNPAVRSILKSSNFILEEKISGIHSHRENKNIFAAPCKMGSSSVAEQIELFSCFGFSTIIQIGLAGSFSEDIRLSDIYISKGAFAESLVPYVYLSKPFSYSPDNPYFFSKTLFQADENLSKDLFLSLSPHFPSGKTSSTLHSGFHFSTDLLYKETTEKFNILKSSDAKVVEMEGATIFSICRSKNIKSSGIYIISDKIAEGTWIQNWGSPAIRDIYHKIIGLLLLE